MNNIREIGNALHLELIRHGVVNGYSSSAKCEFMEMAIRHALKNVCGYDWKQDPEACQYFVNHNEEQNCQYTLDTIIRKILKTRIRGNEEDPPLTFEDWYIQFEPYEGDGVGECRSCGINKILPGNSVCDSCQREVHIYYYG